MFGGEARQTRGNEWGQIGNSHAGVSRFSGEADKGGPSPFFSVLAWAWRQGRNLINLVKQRVRNGPLNSWSRTRIDEGGRVELVNTKTKPSGG